MFARFLIATGITAAYIVAAILLATVVLMVKDVDWYQAFPDEEFPDNRWRERQERATRSRMP